MSFGGPSPPDANSVSQGQLQYNQQAAQMQQRQNMVNQNTPYGNLQYTADPNAPGGYSANVNLTPQQQQLLNLRQGAQTNFGGAAQGLSSQFGSLYGQPPNIDPSTLTNKVMGWGQQYMQPIFNQQQSNLNAQLQNQGITPGSEAFNNAQNLQSRNVNNAYEQLLMQAEPQAFQQAVTEYQLPMNTAMGLMGGAQPQTPNNSYVQTPQEQIGAPNYQQNVQNQYAAQQANSSAMTQGLFGLGGMALNFLM